MTVTAGDRMAILAEVRGTSVPIIRARTALAAWGAKFYKLVGGQHDWYTVPMNAPRNSPFNPDFDARTGDTTDDIVWNFFVTHPKQ